MTAILLSTLITLIISFSAFLERPIDLKIIRGKHTYSNFFVKHKHWFYNAPRLIIWGLCCLMFIRTNDIVYAVELSILDAVANLFLFRYLHDSLYAMIVYGETGIGRGFKQDKIETLYEGRSFWDTIIADSWHNRKLCFYFAITIKIVTLIYITLI